MIYSSERASNKKHSYKCISCIFLIVRAPLYKSFNGEFVPVYIVACTTVEKSSNRRATPHSEFLITDEITNAHNIICQYWAVVVAPNSCGRLTQQSNSRWRNAYIALRICYIADRTNMRLQFGWRMLQCYRISHEHGDVYMHTRYIPINAQTYYKINK